MGFFSKKFAAPADGKSAYQLAVASGFSGSEAQYLASLHGQDGHTPQKGVDYDDGVDGYTPVKGTDYNDGKDGAPGVTPAEITELQNGFNSGAYIVRYNTSTNSWPARPSTQRVVFFLALSDSVPRPTDAASYDLVFRGSAS